MPGAAHEPPFASVRDATLADLEVAAGWVGSEEECLLWAGPDVSFPLELERLAAEIGLDGATSLALTDSLGTVAFGQLVWARRGTAHLARVIVRPDARGLGHGHALVQALLERAAADGAHLATLNVFARNQAAIRLYETAGFQLVGQASVSGSGTAVWRLTREVAPPRA